MTAQRQWTWRQHKFIAEGDAATVRAEAEAAAHICQAANPGADVGVMTRLVTPMRRTRRHSGRERSGGGHTGDRGQP
ncbi:MAG TPA: hypothetical protein VG317_20060 [Pseudonocardiaceae bacterium]|nr:hypothetical protein [Pseudonocardiaceae bacterium]